MAYRAFKFIVQPLLLDADDNEVVAEPAAVSGGIAGIQKWVDEFPDRLAELNDDTPVTG